MWAGSYVYKEFNGDKIFLGSGEPGGLIREPYTISLSDVDPESRGCEKIVS
jgi:hypothetical protein